MRRVVLATALLSGCSLVTPFRDFENGGGEDASVDAAIEGSVESDASTANDTGATDAGADGTLSPSQIYRAAIMADDPIAYFRFEETSGTTTKDETGKHTATLMFAPNLAAPGLFGATDGIEFPKDSQSYVKVDGTDTRFPSTTPFTIEVWVHPALFRDWQWIASTEATLSPRGGWSVFATANGYASYEQWPSNGRNLVLDGRPLVLDKWQHVVFTYSGAVLAGWIDGVKAESTPTVSPGDDVGALTFGCRIGDGTQIQCLDGWRLDEIALYSAVLPDARIIEHYALGAPK